MNRKDVAILVLVVVLITWNFYIFVYSATKPWLEYYPVAGRSVKISSDFSAFYNAAYSLLNNPSQVYHWGFRSTSYPIPYGQDFRYPPYFLLFVLPLLALPFAQAKFIFSLAQFFLLPLIAGLIWKILSPRKLWEYGVMGGVMVLTFLEPFTVVNVNYPLKIYFDLSYGSYAYYWQWYSGQSKILELTLILLSLYLAKRGSWLASFVLIIGAFDPRFTLMSLPLFLYLAYRSGKLKNLIFGCLLALVPISIFVVGFGNLMSQYFTLPQYQIILLYPYEWILFVCILSLSLGYLFIELSRKYEVAQKISAALTQTFPKASNLDYGTGSIQEARE